MSAPERAARLWLALAVATLWMVSVGGALEVDGPADAAELPELRSLLGTMGTTTGRQRRLRVLRLGWLWCLVCQITTGALPLPHPCVPEPWPQMPTEAVVVSFHQHPLE